MIWVVTRSHGRGRERTNWTAAALYTRYTIEAVYAMVACLLGCVGSTQTMNSAKAARARRTTPMSRSRVGSQSSRATPSFMSDPSESGPDAS